MSGQARPLAIVGASGHGRVVIDAARRSGQFDLVGLVDASVPAGSMVAGIAVVGPDDALVALADMHPGLACIVAIGDNAVRARVADALAARGLGFAAVVHPAGVIAESAHIAPGAFVAAGAIVNPDARIGAHAIVNTCATVDHDAQVGDFAFVGPNAALAGGVVLGRGAMVGIGACVTPGIVIGDRATVGAGAVVIRDVGAGERVAGNPARRLSANAGAKRPA
ncbi:MAG: acetyltransferase [Alphaproteobacteria bacterium]